MSIDTVTARIADIRSTIATLGVQPPTLTSGSVSPLAANGSATASSDDFASQLSQLTGQPSPAGATASIASARCATRSRVSVIASTPATPHAATSPTL